MRIISASSKNFTDELAAFCRTAASSKEMTDSVAAILAAVEVAWPRAGSAATPAEAPRWRWSGRWWSKPIPARRARPDAYSQSQNPDVLDARIRQHALVVGLTEDENGGPADGDQPEQDQQVLAERRLSRGRTDLVAAQDLSLIHI